jgi:hypothetical protein
MVGPRDGLEERLSVVSDATVFHPVAVAVGVNDHVARSQVVGDRVADAPQVHRSHLAHMPIGRLVRVPGEHELRIGAGEILPELDLVAMWRDAIPVVAPRSRVHAEDARAVGESDADLERKITQPTQPLVGGKSAGGPRERSLDRSIELQQRRVGDDIVGMWRWAVTGEDVALCVPASEMDARQIRDQLHGSNRVRPDRDQVTQDPPGVDPLLARVGDHRLDRVAVAMHVRHERALHLISLPEPMLATNRQPSGATGSFPRRSDLLS